MSFEDDNPSGASGTMRLLTRDVADGAGTSSPVGVDTVDKTIAVAANSFQYILVVASVHTRTQTGASNNVWNAFIKIGASEKLFAHGQEGNVGSGNDAGENTNDISYSAALQGGGNIEIGMKTEPSSDCFLQVKTVHVFGIV